MRFKPFIGPLAQIVIVSSFFSFSQVAYSEAPFVVQGEYVIERSNIATNSTDLDLPVGAHIIRSGKSTMLVSMTADASQISSNLNQVTEYDPRNDRCSSIMESDKNILSCSPNFLRRFAAVPNDPYYSFQWAYGPSSSFGIEAQSGWDVTRGSRNVAIGILDSGVDYYHEDLKDNIWVNPFEIPGNGIDDEGNGYVDDIHGINSVSMDGDPIATSDHGSHVAGIVAGKGNNGVGVCGVSWETSLIAVNAEDTRGGLSTFAILNGLDYFIDLKLRREVNLIAVNASFGGGGLSDTELRGYERLRNAGIILVAAAGNSSANNDLNSSYPCNILLDNVICVAALNRFGVLAGFSNFGSRTVHLAAPGEEILSTVAGAGYDVYPGTSMAAPMVTGAVALIAALRPGIPYQQNRELILGTGTSLSSLQGKVTTGTTLNISKLLETGKHITLPTPTPSSDDDASIQIADGNFRVNAFRGKKVRGLKALNAKSKFFIDLSRTDFKQRPGTARAYVNYILNGIKCDQDPIPLYMSNEGMTLEGRLSGAKGRNLLTIEVKNGQGSVTDKRKVVFYTLNGDSLPPKKLTKSKKYINKVCASVGAKIS